MYVGICPIIVGPHMNILFTNKVKILKLIEWEYGSPPPFIKKNYQYNLLSLEWLINFEHIVQSLWNTCIFGVHSHIYT